VSVNGDASVKDQKRGTSVSEKNQEQLIEDEVSIPRRVGDRDEYVEFVSRYDESRRNFNSYNSSTLAKGKEGHIVDDCSATEHKMNEECSENVNVAASTRTLCFTTTSSNTDVDDTRHAQQGMDTGQIMTEKMITAEQLRGKVSENNNLSP
jgi:hypothetical protein